MSFQDAYHGCQRDYDGAHGTILLFDCSLGAVILCNKSWREIKVEDITWPSSLLQVCPILVW